MWVVKFENSLLWNQTENKQGEASQKRRGVTETGSQIIDREVNNSTVLHRTNWRVHGGDRKGQQQRHRTSWRVHGEDLRGLRSPDDGASGRRKYTKTSFALQLLQQQAAAASTVTSASSKNGSNSLWNRSRYPFVYLTGNCREWDWEVWLMIRWLAGDEWSRKFNLYPPREGFYIDFRI